LHRVISSKFKLCPESSSAGPFICADFSRPPCLGYRKSQSLLSGPSGDP